MGKYSPNLIANSLICISQNNPNGEHLITENKRITWHDTLTRAFQLAQALKKLGIAKRDKVAFMFHNSPEFVEINLAVHVAGAIPVPMNFRFAPDEVKYQTMHCDAKILIYDNLWSENVEPVIEKITNIEHVICRGETHLPGAIDHLPLGYYDQNYSLSIISTCHNPDWFPKDQILFLPVHDTAEHQDRQTNEPH